MLQDFVAGKAFTGRQAFSNLQSIYVDWERQQTHPQKAGRLVWKKVPNDYAALHPSTVVRWVIPPDNFSKWDGPGFYHNVHENPITEAKAALAQLPKGPKWLVALEMWERLSPSYGDRLRLFVSRDNRKQTWRKSLCNPYYQQWGFKPRAAKPLKPKKPKTRSSDGNFRAADWLDRFANAGEAPVRAAAGQAGTGVATAPATKPVKPRVGIWT